MSFVFELPEIGEGVVEGEIVSWLVALGDRVERDAPLCEIMTDKATVEISSPRAGVVTAFHAKPGDIVKVHAPLADIDENGATAPATPAPAPTTAAPAPTTPAPAPARPPASPGRAQSPPPPAGSVRKPAPPAAAPEPTDSVPRAAPAVRRHARELGLDIGQVTGTGPGGRVTHQDLTAPAEAPLPVAPVALPQVQPSGTEQRVPIIGLRRKIAEQMVKAMHTAPHFTYVEEVDGTRLVALRDQLRPKAEARGVKLTFVPLLMKACSVAFRDFPNVNATMDEDRFELVVKGDHNLGISIDTPQGLYVGVIRNVEQKSILHLAAELQGLADRVRANKATRDDLTGGTFTITSVGAIGGVLATPILNVPEVAILGFNAIRDRAVVVDGQIVVRKMFYLSPSFDHRVIDGAVGARFTARLKEILEEPEALLLELV